MSNPEKILQQCDGCEGYLYDSLASAYRYEVRGRNGTQYDNHSEAWADARAAGWYIAEKDLCPECREKMEVPE